MSKQKRTGRRAEHPAPVAGSQEEVSEQLTEGNQALLEQLEGAAVEMEATVGTDAVRAVALPLVERGVFALNTEVRPAETIQKYVSVLETSRLPSDRKALLIGKLTSDQEAAVQAREAVERHFGAGPEGVDRAHDLLEGVWAGLNDPAGRAPEGRHASERAERWIEQLAGPEGKAVQAFCREVHFLVRFDEEEEEDVAESAFTVEVE